MRSPTISIYKPNSNSLHLEGDELRVCYNTDTEFLARLAHVKAETLSKSGRVSQVGRVTSWVTGLRHFPYPGAIGLAKLGRDKLG
jgi:hypothetical protein